MKNLFAVCFLMVASVALAEGADSASPKSITLPAGASMTLGDTVVSCAPSAPAEVRYVCSQSGRTGEGKTLQAAFVRLQGALGDDQRCLAEMFDVCMREWCARD